MGGRAAMGLHKGGEKGIRKVGGKRDKEGLGAVRGLRWTWENRRNGGGGGTGMGGRAAMGLTKRGKKG